MAIENWSNELHWALPYDYMVENNPTTGVLELEDFLDIETCRILRGEKIMTIDEIRQRHDAGLQCYNDHVRFLLNTIDAYEQEVRLLKAACNSMTVMCQPTQTSPAEDSFWGRVDSRTPTVP